MSASNKDIRNKVRQWLDYAEEDLKFARHGLTLGTEAPFRLVAYHAQQCAEKSLKAFLVYHREDFPFTHNISILLELCEKYVGWPAVLQEAEILTSYTISVRYPGEDEIVTEPQARSAILLAQKVKQKIEDSLSGI